MSLKLWVENSLSLSMVKMTILNISFPLPPYVPSMLPQMPVSLFVINLMSVSLQLIDVPTIIMLLPCLKTKC